MQSEFQAFVSDEISYATAYGWAEKQGFPTSSIQQGGPDVCAKFFELHTPSRLLLVDVDGIADPVGQMASLAVQCGASTKVMALGTANDVGLYRQLLTAGVADYLVKPLTPEQLSQAMAQVLRGDDVASGGGIKEAKITVILGVRGGVGASTLAMNTAWILARDLGRQTTLVDLDLQFGTTSLALDLEPGRGLRDLVSSPQRVDNLMITSSLVAAADRLSVLSAEENIDDILPIDGSAVTLLMKEMRPLNDFIIVDLPRSMVATQKRLLAAAHEIVLVTELSLVGIRDTLRMRTCLKSLGCPARVSVVATRIGPQRPSQVDEGTFSKGIQARLDFSMPDDYKNLAEASNSGKALAMIAPHAPLTKAIRVFAEYLMGPQGGHAKKKSLFGWLKKDDGEDAP